MKQGRPRPAKNPPQDQWVVDIPIDMDAPHDMSFVGYTRGQVERYMVARFGDGRLERTQVAGLLRFCPERYR